MRSIFAPGYLTARSPSNAGVLGCFGVSHPYEDGEFAMGWPIPVLHYLTPLQTTWSPSTTAAACMLVASDDATAGSVMQNAERMVPSSNALSQRRFCASDPHITSTSMLPVRGVAVEHLGRNGGAACDLGQGRVFQVGKAGPYSGSGKNRFHRPAALAFAFSSSMTRGLFQGRSPPLSWRPYSGSAGMTCSAMKTLSRPR